MIWWSRWFEVQHIHYSGRCMYEAIKATILQQIQWIVCRLCTILMRPPSAVQKTRPPLSHRFDATKLFIIIIITIIVDRSLRWQLPSIWNWNLIAHNDVVMTSQLTVWYRVSVFRDQCTILFARSAIKRAFHHIHSLPFWIECESLLVCKQFRVQPCAGHHQGGRMPLLGNVNHLAMSVYVSK